MKLTRPLTLVLLAAIGRAVVARDCTCENSVVTCSDPNDLDLKVKKGKACTLSGPYLVEGNVKVDRGATLYLGAVNVTGNIAVLEGASLTVQAEDSQGDLIPSIIKGDIKADKANSVTVTDSIIFKKIHLKESNGDVIKVSRCTVGDDIVVDRQTTLMSLTISDNTLAEGKIVVVDMTTSGIAEIKNNVISTELKVEDNVFGDGCDISRNYVIADNVEIKNNEWTNECTITENGPSPPPVTLSPVTAAPVTPAPVTPAPVTSAPMTAAPVTAKPSGVPTITESFVPSSMPSVQHSNGPTAIASTNPSSVVSENPTASSAPSSTPSLTSSSSPTVVASANPSSVNSENPTASSVPSSKPSLASSSSPTVVASTTPSSVGSETPTASLAPSSTPSLTLSSNPTVVASANPSAVNSEAPTPTASSVPSVAQSMSPTAAPATPSPVATGFTLYMNAGSVESYTELSTGIDWVPDAYFTPGANRYKTGGIITGGDQTLFETERWHPNLEYNIPVDNVGQYKVQLSFAEIYQNSPNMRRFSVEVEGSLVVTDLDIFVEAPGRYVPIMREATVNVTDGILNIKFLSIVDNPKISTIAIEQEGESWPTAPSPVAPSPSPPASYNELLPSCDVTGSTSFTLCVDLSTGSEVFEQSFYDAYVDGVARWQTIITGDMYWSFTRDQLLSFEDQYACNQFPEVVDDLYVCAKTPVIDGPGGILGSAGAQLGTGDPWMPVVGQMQFDSADTAGLLANGAFEDVVIHELGHIIGIGPLWEGRDLYNATTGMYHSGTYADAAWVAMGCQSGTLPLETTGGAGTAYVHWDEECLRDEAMTGYLSSTVLPISNISVSSLIDLGYEVDVSKSDPFTKEDDLNLGVCCFDERRQLSETPRVRSSRARRGTRGSKQLFENEERRPSRSEATGVRKRKPTQVFKKKKKGAKGLSREGHQKVLDYAKVEMKKQRSRKRKTKTKLPKGLVDVSGEHLSVLYLEDGKFHTVGVSWDEVAY